jgi:hypothetical protein
MGCNMLFGGRANQSKKMLDDENLTASIIIIIILLGRYRIVANILHKLLILN